MCVRGGAIEKEETGEDVFVCAENVHPHDLPHCEAEQADRTAIHSRPLLPVHRLRVLQHGIQAAAKGAGVALVDRLQTSIDVLAYYYTSHSTLRPHGI